jgi:hypothetical protein
MIRHAARGVPWLLFGAAAALLGALLLVVAWKPYVMWPLQGVAVGLVAGIAAFAYDEPAAAVVDTLPRGLGWRTTARSLGVVGLLCWWLAVVIVTRDAYFGHPADVAWQGVAATVAVVAVTALLRRRGFASPATLVASAVVGGAAYLALARPFDDHLTAFPYTAAASWDTSRTLWTTVALIAGMSLFLTLTRTTWGLVVARLRIDQDR